MNVVDWETEDWLASDRAYARNRNVSNTLTMAWVRAWGVGLLVALSGHGVLAAASAGTNGLDLGIDHAALAKLIDAKQMRADVEQLASWPSRALGYEGAQKAVEYIVGRLKQMGYDARTETFPAVMPIDRGGRLEAEGLDSPIPIHAFWPNLSRTPSTKDAGLTGELIYAHTGEYRYYNGRDVDGSIVVLDFNSTNNYLKAFMLGARAVIFLEPHAPERKEAEAKLINVPLYAPKYYVAGKHKQRLLALAEQRATATVRCRMAWERVTGTNIMVHVEGTEPALKGDAAMIVGYFDAMSAVPGLCPGADQASGIAVWLQMAKLLKQHPPARPVTLFATNGHFMNNTGVKNFLLRHPKNPKEVGAKFYQSALREGKKWAAEHAGIWRLRTRDVDDWPAFCAALAQDAHRNTPNIGKRLWKFLDEAARTEAASDDPNEIAVADAINDALKLAEFYDEASLAGAALPNDAAALLARGMANLSDREVEHLNRRLLEAAYAEHIETRIDEPLWPAAVTGYRDGSTWLKTEEVRDWPGLCSKLAAGKGAAAKRLWSMLSEGARESAATGATGERLDDAQKAAIVKALNVAMKQTDLCKPEDFGSAVPAEAAELLARERAKLSARQVQRLNRLLLEALFPQAIAKSVAESDYLDRRFAVCLDLSSHSSVVGVFANGVRGLDETNQAALMWPVNNALREHADAAFGKEAERRFYSGISGTGGITWDSMLPCDLAFDSRPFLDLRREAVAIGTTLDMRLAVDTPMDRVEFVDFDALAAQARIVAQVLGGLMLDKRRLPRKKSNLPELLDFARTRALYLDPKKMTYTGIAEQPVPNVLILLEDFDAQRAQPGNDAKRECSLGHTGVRAWGHMITNADGWACMVFDGPDPKMRKDAYLVEADGALSMSIDQGIFGVGRVGGEGGVSASTPTVLFPFQQLEFYETLDVRSMTYVSAISLLDQNDGFPQRWGGRSNGRAAMIALDPMWRLKLIAGGSGDFALLLLNTTKDKPTGLGFGPQPDGRIPASFFQAAMDQERLVRFRRDRMQQCGIRYPFTDAMVDQAAASINKALAEKQQRNYSAAMHDLFDTVTRAGTAYPLIWNVMTDTIYGLILAFVLVVPFSIFLERLLFGIAELQRRLMVVVGIFILICLILNVLHPGFEVATSPYLIPLAFVILSLVLIVLTMMLAKFDRQVQELHDVAARVHGQDVNRAGATWAGFALGIGNMRRRKTRTSLTLLTLVLLTYSLLSLTSGEISRKQFRAEFDHAPSYPGVMIRDRQWGSMSEAAPEVLRTTFSKEAAIAPRCWIYRGSEQTLLIPVERAGKRVFVDGMAGFAPEEADVSGINQEVEGGLWFTHDPEPQCMLPENVANQLDLTQEDVGQAKVRIYGRDFKLVGIFQPGRLQEIKDLDGEHMAPLMPIRAQGSTIGGLAQFVHLDMDTVVFANYAAMRNMGAPIKSVALRFKDPLRGERLVQDFASRSEALCFIALGDKVEAWSYLGFVWVAGLGDLVIPLLIGGLIILNTMLTSVYERSREIAIFGSVGLSPIHISTLFFAESAVYGVLGIMLGYFVGQISAFVIIKFGLVTGLSLNYSSASAVLVSVLVLVLIMVSTAYPARVAYKMSTPSVARSWSPPPPEGTVWNFEMPFHVPVAIAPGIAAFFYRYFESYREASVGVFFTDVVALERGERDGQAMIQTKAEIWLTPFDAGVKQAVSIAFPHDPKDARVCDVCVRLEHLTGTPGDWQRMNKRFFRVLRKQFLIWRTIKRAQRTEYIEQGQRVLAP